MSEFFDEIMASIDETREVARNKTQGLWGHTIKYHIK